MNDTTKLPCGHTLKQHMRMEEAKASAEIEGAQSDKTVCELIDIAESQEPAAPQSSVEEWGRLIEEQWALLKCARVSTCCDASVQYYGLDRPSCEHCGDFCEVTDDDDAIRHMIENQKKILAFTRTLQSERDKAQEEARRYREDAERMFKALMDLVESSNPGDAIVAIEALSSLHHPYPPTE